MSKKILMLLSNAFDPDPRVHQEAVHLVRNGYDIQLICWDRDRKAKHREIQDAINIERIYVRSTHGRGIGQVFYLLLFWIKAFSRALFKNFDIIHCHDYDTLPLGYLLSRIKRRKLVYDAHESYVDMLGNIPPWLRTIIFRSENFFLKRTHLLITVGELLRQALAARGATNTCIVGNWKDPSQFRFNPEELEKERARFNIENGNLVISFIANLGLERQIPQLLEAVMNSPDRILIIGGDGPCREMIEDATKKTSNIHYLGRVNPSKVPLYTALSDVIFYGFDPRNPNARYSAPNKLFEALAAGKAIITGDFGEIARIVREEDCGIVLKEYTVEAIQKALTEIHSGRLKQYKNRALEAGVSRYSWQRAGEKLLSNYREVL